MQEEYVQKTRERGRHTMMWKGFIFTCNKPELTQALPLLFPDSPRSGSMLRTVTGNTCVNQNYHSTLIVRGVWVFLLCCS